jgi:hypothetical protein
VPLTCAGEECCQLASSELPFSRARSWRVRNCRGKQEGKWKQYCLEERYGMGVRN